MEERSFLISESVRGEGAVLYNANKERFVNELLPRDALTKEIYSQMEKDGKPGYKVKYKDGYESWSPKEVFEEAYRELDCLDFINATE